MIEPTSNMGQKTELTEAEIPPIYACADVFTIASLGEGWCLPANDMGAMQKPSVLPDYSGYKEYLNNDNSWLVPLEKFGPDNVMDNMDPIYRGLNHFPVYDKVVVIQFAGC